MSVLENVTRIPSSKNHSLAFRILAGLAAGSKARGAEGWVKDGELARLVTEALEDWGEIARAAQVCLNELVMSLAEDDEAGLYVATALQGMALLDVAAIKPLFQALSLRWVAVGLPQLTEYRDLLARYSNDEPAIHRFLELNPLFLGPLALRVWSKPDLHGKKEPDFIVQRSDNIYLVVEIETPTKPLVTKGNQVSALVTQAVAQVMEYRSFLVERFSDAAATFPNFTVPGALVVIGLEGEMSDSQREVLRRENDHRAHVRIVGFDTLADRAEVITRNVIGGNVSVQPGRLK